MESLRYQSVPLRIVEEAPVTMFHTEIIQNWWQNIQLNVRYIGLMNSLGTMDFKTIVGQHKLFLEGINHILIVKGSNLESMQYHTQRLKMKWHSEEYHKLHWYQQTIKLITFLYLHWQANVLTHIIGSNYQQMTTRSWKLKS